MATGNFRHQAIFSTREDTTDSIGQPSDIYTPVRTEGVELQQLSGNERQRFTQGVATDEDFIAMICRYSLVLDNIPTSARVRINNDNYEIASKSLLNFRQQFMRFVIRGVR